MSSYLYNQRKAPVLKVAGADVADLLQRVSTQDVSALEMGKPVFTVFTTEKGRIAEMAHILPLGEHQSYLFLLLGCFEGDFGEWLSRYVIMEDVVIDRIPVGSGHWIAFQDGFTDAPLSGSICDTLRDSGFEVAEERYRDRTFLRIADTEGQDGAERLLEHLAHMGHCDSMTFHGARIEAGIPFPGKELSDSFNPMEALLREHISFTKGCYVGQEVIARLDSYRKVSRLLVRLRGAGEGAPGMLRVGDKDAGVITSVHQSGEQEWMGMGYVKTFAIESNELRMGQSGHHVEIVDADRLSSVYGGTHV